MNKHKLGIMLLGIVVGVSCVVGITIVGSPVSQRHINFDTTRIGDFQNMKYQVEEYYRQNSRLPLNMTEIERIYSSTAQLPKDPESGNAYTYQTVSTTSYEFCTTFSTDSEEVKERNDGRDAVYYPVRPAGGDDLSHQKGYDCITYTIPAYQLSPTPFIYPPMMREPLRKPDPATDLR